MIYICYANEVKPIVIQILIDNGININHKDNDGWNILTYASCKQTPLSVWEILVDSGADVKIIDNNRKNIIDRVLSQYSYAVILHKKIIKTLI